MKIQYCSDLHLEFRENKDFLKANPIQIKGEILLLAGDIIPFIELKKHSDFFDFIADNFAFIYWIPGNHEYYFYDAATRSGILHERIRNNVFLVNNITQEHDHVKLIFSTLWSYISPTAEWEIERNMSDFQIIKYNTGRFTTAVYNQLHADCLAFIKKEATAPSDKNKIVVTHHVPTYMHYPAQYKGSILNQAFASEQHDFIHSSDIHSWIYGHHHCNSADFLIGNTRMLTNQLGYVKNGEHQQFACDKMLVF